MTFEIVLPHDYQARYALRYMTRDPESESERGDATGFAKALVLGGKPSIVRVDLRGARIALVAVEGSRSRVAAERAVLRLLGLPFDPRPFETRHAKLVGDRRGMRVPQTATVFEAVVWAICGQQVNLAFAYKLRRAVIELAGTRIDGMRAHPDAAAVAALDYSDLTQRQFSRRKAEYLIDAARTFDSEDLDELTPAEAEEKLRAVRGFGVWSANYVMMRGCGFTDCVPVGDTGLTSSLQDFYSLDQRPDEDETLTLMKRFAPYRSLATFHFWMRNSNVGF